MVEWQSEFCSTMDRSRINFGELVFRFTAQNRHHFVEYRNVFVFEEQFQLNAHKCGAKKRRNCLPERVFTETGSTHHFSSRLKRANDNVSSVRIGKILVELCLHVLWNSPAAPLVQHSSNIWTVQACSCITRSSAGRGRGWCLLFLP